MIINKENVIKYISTLSEDDIKDRLENYSKNTFYGKFGWCFKIRLNRNNESQREKIKSDMLNLFFAGDPQFIEAFETAKLMIKYQITESNLTRGIRQRYDDINYEYYLKHCIDFLAEIRFQND